MEVSAIFSSLPTLMLLVVLGPILLYWWYKSKQQSYWHDKGIPYTPSGTIFGLLRVLLSNPIHVAEVEKYKKYGKIYGSQYLNQAVLTVADPDLLRNILVKDFQYFTSRRDLRTGNTIADNMVSMLQGEAWKRVRTIISPAFATGKIKNMVNIFMDSSKSLAQSFEQHAKAGKPIDGKSLFGAFTMDIIASSAFGTKIDSHNDPNNTFVMHAKKAFGTAITWRFIFLFMFPKIAKFFGLSVFSTDALKFFKEITLKIIEQRKRSGQTRNDFLQLMMDSTSELSDVSNGAVPAENFEDADVPENRDLEHGEDNANIFKLRTSHKALTHDELVAQCVAFFIAGYDTTASTLAFASYELALNHEVQQKLIAEIDASIIEHHNQLTYEAVQDMKYLDNVISEVLRKYPPAIRLERQVDDDYVLGDTGLTIKKGMIIGIPVYAMHHDAELYNDPEKFCPERFSAREKAQRNPYIFLPFGAGPRNCLGMRFALMEIKICLAYTLSQFRFKTCPQTKVPLEFHFGMGLLQPKAVMFAVEPRADKVL